MSVWENVRTLVRWYASTMVKIKINNKEVEVAEGTTVLKAALANKVDIPYFCYHPKLSISGNCRMCLVNIKGQNKPVISCRERVREGMEVDTKSEEVKKMQQGVLEFILVNHPLDCPICDQSGECDLQDNYFKFSKFPSRLEDQKIHKPKVKSLGPLVTLDDERCIVCTRCVRFCDEVACEKTACLIVLVGEVFLNERFDSILEFLFGRFGPLHLDDIHDAEIHLPDEFEADPFQDELCRARYR